jgi:hypothetical protein
MRTIPVPHERVLEAQENLDLHQGNVAELVVENDAVVGAETGLGMRFRAKSVVITTGTFMRGLLHVGLQKPAGWPHGRHHFDLERSSCVNWVSRSIASRPARPVASMAASIDFSKCERQDGDDPAPPFSFPSVGTTLAAGPNDIHTLNAWGDPMFHVEQMPCWITYTNPATHDIIRANLDKSPMYCGRIEGSDPATAPRSRTRWCALPRRSGTRSSSNRRVGTPTNTTSTGSRPVPCPTRSSYDFIRSIPGLENCRDHPSRLRGRIRLLPTHPALPHPGNEARLRPLLRRPDQRHLRLRGSRRPGPHRRGQCRPQSEGRPGVGARPRRGLPRGDDRRPRHQGHHRALPDVHLAAPNTASCSARTTPTSG